VDLAYVLARKDKSISYGEVRNQEGEYVAPTLKGVTAAATRTFKRASADPRHSVCNAPGKGVYPISGLVWGIVYVDQPAHKARQLRTFLHWALHEGQTYLAHSNFARLPSVLVNLAEEQIQRIGISSR
jgi:phosphate transport system substrate-binding protein